MRDIDIRSKLRDKLDSIYIYDPDSRVIEEFGLCNGTVRIDLATVDGLLNGYEIKSDKDTLRRLPLQQEIYSQVFDKITIITSGQHSKNIIEKIPNWWGIWRAIKDTQGVRFEVVRSPELNPDIDPQSLVQCLWRDEVLHILKERGLAKGLLSKPRDILRKKLATSIPLEELKVLVRQTLKARDNWRPDAPQVSSDD